MKKSFTLIEIIITLLLIALVLSMVTSMGSSFSDRIRFSNTKEEVTAAVNGLITESAPTNMISVGSGMKRYGQLDISFSASGNSILFSYSSGELAEVVSGEITISRGSVSTSGFKLQLTPYAIGCHAAESNAFRVMSADDLKLQACYYVETATCKLKESACN